jgi:ABC-2 type transport system ATP-binding protein
MGALIEAKGISKYFGRQRALDDVSFRIQAGAITGLIGPNGAGKTTALKALLGLCSFNGELTVAGRDPRAQRHLLMEDVCFIADVGILPKWLRVSQAIDFVDGVHPRFNREKAERLLARTDVKHSSKIKELSKGMVTQLHLALIMAIDVRVLVLDEPTLGLDIMYRKEFYDRLLSEYYDAEKTVIISTHQVEEIENLLTQLLFIQQGRIILDIAMDEIPARFHEVAVAPERYEEARYYNPVYERELLGRKAFLFEDSDPARLQVLGELHTPSVSDLFVAMMTKSRKSGVSS